MLSCPGMEDHKVAEIERKQRSDGGHIIKGTRHQLRQLCVIVAASGDCQADAHGTRRVPRRWCEAELPVRYFSRLVPQIADGTIDFVAASVHIFGRSTPPLIHLVERAFDDTEVAVAFLIGQRSPACEGGDGA